MTTSDVAKTDRIAGVDALRGLAVLGMMAAHVGKSIKIYPGDSGGWTWLDVFDGRSAATFALLLGVSVTLLSRGRTIRFSRARIATRAVLLVGLGMVLMELKTPVDVILVNSGVMMLVAIIALRWRTWVLLTVATAFATVGSLFWTAIHTYDPLGVLSGRPVPRLFESIWGIHYPVMVWMAYALAGMAIARMDLRSLKVLATMLLIGAALVIVELTMSGCGASQPMYEGVDILPSTPAVHVLQDGWWSNTAPHANSPAEVVGNTGMAAIVLAIFCLGTLHWKRALLPLSAVGAMALTAYSGHIVVIWWSENMDVFDPHNATLVEYWVVTIVLCVVWTLALGRGPLERAMHAVSMRMAGSDERR